MGKSTSAILCQCNKTTNTCLGSIANVESMLRIYKINEQHIKSLTDALSSNYYNNIDFTNILNVILSFIKDLNCLFYHSNINDYINNNGYLCKQWINDFIPNKIINIALIGNPHIGKSSLVTRYCWKKFIDCLDPTIEDSYRKIEYIKNETITLNILDSATPLEYFENTDMAQHWGVDPKWSIDYANIIALCFDMNDEPTLDVLTRWKKAILAMYPTNDDAKGVKKKGLILIGTKMDLYRNCKQDKMMNKFETCIDKGITLAKKWNVPLICTSSLEDINVNFLFKQIIFEYWFQTEFENVRWGKI
eukprot:182344_1